MGRVERGTEVLDFLSLSVGDEERAIMLLCQELAYNRLYLEAAAADRESRAPRDNLLAIRTHGLLDIRIPALFGGKGLESLAFAAAIVELAKGDPTTAWFLGQHSTVMTLIEQLGQQTTQAHFFRLVVEEGASFAPAVMEPGWNPFDGSLPSTQVTETQEGYRINGVKTNCILADQADYFFVNATAGSDVFGIIIPKQADGVKLGDVKSRRASRRGAFQDVLFENVTVPTKNILKLPLNLLFELEYELASCAVFIGMADAGYRIAREAAKQPMRAIVEGGSGHGHPDAGRVFTEVGRCRLQIQPGWLTVLRAATTGAVGSFERGLALIEARHSVGLMCESVLDSVARIVGLSCIEQIEDLRRLSSDAKLAGLFGVKPSDAAYLAGRFELGVAIPGMEMDPSQMRIP